MRVLRTPDESLIPALRREIHAMVRHCTADGAAPIWTTTGRLKGVAFTGSAGQLVLLAAHRRGESDLVCRDGMWFLHATVEVADVPIAVPDGFLGIDLGIVNIATTSDGTRHSGKRLNAVRHRNRELCRRLQAKRTKSARRLLKKRRRKEARFAADTTTPSPSRS